jgi:hypothetical protein
VHVLIDFFWIKNNESRLALFLSAHIIAQYDKYGRMNVLYRVWRDPSGRNGLTLRMIPLYFDMVLVTCELCDFQDRLLSIKIPKNLVVLTLFITLLSIFIVTSIFGLLLCLFLNIMKLVLSMFNESLFNLNQFDILFNSILIRLSSIRGSSCEKIILVSSAKIMKFELGEQVGRSLIYNKNKRGPRTDP